MLQRIAVTLSCIAFGYLIMERQPVLFIKNGLFALVCTLACIEKLSAVMNTIAVERDWVGSDYACCREDARLIFSRWS